MSQNLKYKRRAEDMAQWKALDSILNNTKIQWHKERVRAISQNLFSKHAHGNRILEGIFIK